MTIQDCIKLLTAHNGWTFVGSYIYEEGNGTFRQRRYEFSKDGQTFDFNSRSIRWRAKTIQQVQAGDKYFVHHYA